MPANFRDIADLDQWVQSHQDLGKIKGEYMFSSERVELRGAFIPADLYNRVLLIAKTMNYSKSDVARSAIELYNRTPIDARSYLDKIYEVDVDEYDREFRFHVPTELLTYRPESLCLQVFVAIALTMWADLNEEFSQAKIEKRAKELGVTPEDVKNSIYDQWLIESREKRLKRSKSLGYLVRDSKM